MTEPENYKSRVNLQVDTLVELVEVPGVPVKTGTVWKIRALQIDGKSLALDALENWQRTTPADYKKILKAMEIAVSKVRVQSPNHVKKCSDPAYETSYEFRAHRGSARLMFFYDTNDGNIIICTNGMDKGENQNNAFQFCNKFETFYNSCEKTKKSKP
jgi:hypothetical protein